MNSNQKRELSEFMIIAIAFIVCITFLISIALALGRNGYMYSAGFSAICFIFGWIGKHYREKFRNNRNSWRP